MIDGKQIRVSAANSSIISELLKCIAIWMIIKYFLGGQVHDLALSDYTSKVYLAADIAGLNVQYLGIEPSVTCMGHNYYAPEPEKAKLKDLNKNFMVFDFGGGIYPVAIISLCD